MWSKWGFMKSRETIAPSAIPDQSSTPLLAAQFRQNGYVVIENALPLNFIASVRTAFLRVMNDKVKRFNISPVKPTDGRDKANDNVRLDFRPEGGNHDLNRWNMHLPSDPQFLNEQIIANPLALPIIKELLGLQPVAFLIASDTPYPGSGFQNIHQDFPRFGLTVNIPLVDFTQGNAPLEVWRGSHVRGNSFHAGAVDLSSAEIKAFTQKNPGQRLLIKAGSILIRDQRMLHRGTANTSAEPRPCLSIWYKNLDHFSLPGLSIPVPRRDVADFMAKLALKMRQDGRGGGGAVQNKKLLLLGNFFGRIVEETSASDRDFRRSISRQMWAGYSPEMRSLLRYATVTDTQENKRSLLGSFFLTMASVVFAARAWQLRRSKP